MLAEPAVSKPTTIIEVGIFGVELLRLIEVLYGLFVLSQTWIGLSASDRMLSGSLDSA